MSYLVQYQQQAKIIGNQERELSEMIISLFLSDDQVPHGILYLNTPCIRYVFTVSTVENGWELEVAKKLNEIRLRKGLDSTILFTLKRVFNTKYLTTVTVDTLTV